MNFDALSPFHSRVAKAVIILTVINIALAILYGIKYYGLIPWWDMWGGTVRFFLDAQSGREGVWFAQHNEHRIFLSRLTFWLDYQLFGGRHIFLFVFNYLVAALGGFLLIKILREAIAFSGYERTDTYFPEVLLSLFFAGWVFLLTQRDPLAWAFNGGFLLSVIIPLSAFYFIYKSHRFKSLNNFIVAALLGVASVGAMAGGLAVLPLLFVYTIFTRMSWWRCVLLGGLSIVFTLLYMHGYESVDHHDSLSETLLTQPFAVLHFTLNFLGSIFFFFSGGLPLGPITAPIAGVIFLALLTYALWDIWRDYYGRSFRVMLVLFLFYVGMNAVAAGAGRVSSYGVETAFAPRYTTFGVYAWAVLGILYLPFLLRCLETPFKRKFVYSGYGIAMALLFTAQMTALLPKSDWAKGHHVAALAAELGVDDNQYLKQLYPDPVKMQRIARRMSDADIGFMGDPGFKDARETMGRQITDIPEAKCDFEILSFDSLSPKSKAGYSRVQGKIVSDIFHLPRYVDFLNKQNKVIGRALLGVDHLDAEIKTSKISFTGYIKTNNINNLAYLIGKHSDCVGYKQK